MNTTLSELKKAIKKIIEDGGHVRKVSVSAEAFGEGYNVYVDVLYWKNNDAHQEYFTMSEEEKKSQADIRMKRIVESTGKIDTQFGTKLEKRVSSRGFTSFQ